MYLNATFSNIATLIIVHFSTKPFVFLGIHQNHPDKNVFSASSHFNSSTHGANDSSLLPHVDCNDLQFMAVCCSGSGFNAWLLLLWMEKNEYR